MEREVSHCSLVPAAGSKFAGGGDKLINKHSIINSIGISVIVAFTMDNTFFCACLEETSVMILETPALVGRVVYNRPEKWK